MREVMEVQWMQRHLPKLEPFLRRVVKISSLIFTLCYIKCL